MRRALRRRLAFLAACLILLTGWMSSRAASGQPGGDVEKQIRQALADWMDATNHRDQKKADEVWAPGVVGWFPAAPAFKLEEAYRVAGAAKTAERPYSTFALTIEEVMVSGDLAVVRDIWRETIHLPPTEASATREIRSFEVWKPQPDGKWKIARWISAPEPWQKAVPK